MDTLGRHPAGRGRANAQARRQDHIWNVPGTARRPMCCSGKWREMKEVKLCKATLRFGDFILRETGSQ